jgi:hypothetical protein
MRVPLAGGSATVVAQNDAMLQGDTPISIAAIADSLAVTDSTAVWVAPLWDHTTGGGYTSKGTALLSVPLAGGTPTTLGTNPHGFGGSVRTDGQNAYWNRGDAIVKVPLTGGTPTTISSPGGVGLAIDATNAYWIANNTNIVSAPLAGGTPSTVVSSGSQAFELTVDATSVYWIVIGGGTAVSAFSAVKAPLGGGTPVTLATVPDDAYALALDGPNLYVGAFSSIVRVPTAGGPQVTLATTKEARSVAVDATRVYWSSSPVGGANGAILAAAK